MSENQKRGERLFPNRSDRAYWVLSELRRVYEECVRKYLAASSGVIADYGCGNMPYRSIFERESLAYIGYDFKGNELAECYLLPDGSLPLAADAVDYVLSSQVLEHVTEVDSYLSEITRVLKPGGKLFLSTHGVWRYHPDPYDYWRWTGDGLVKVISEAGLKIDEVVGIVGPAATGIQLFQDAVSPRVPRGFQKLFHLLCQRFMKYCDQRCSPDRKAKDACVFVCIATLER